MNAQANADSTLELPVGVHQVAPCDPGPPALTTGSSSSPGSLWFCTGCRKWYPRSSSFFYHTNARADQLTTRCRFCLAAYVRVKSKGYRKQNPEKERSRCRRWHRANKDKLAAYHKEWSKRNKERIAANRKRWRAKNKARQREINRKWRDSDSPKALLYRISLRLRNRIRGALSRKKISRSARVKELLGCSMEEFKSYLESRFLPGMSWDNYGHKEGIACWHIDHVRECCEFDLSSSQQQRECFHYTNLQPLWDRDNYEKEFARKRRAAEQRRIANKEKSNE